MKKLDRVSVEVFLDDVGYFAQSTAPLLSICKRKLRLSKFSETHFFACVVWRVAL